MSKRRVSQISPTSNLASEDDAASRDHEHDGKRQRLTSSADPTDGEAGRHHRPGVDPTHGPGLAPAATGEQDTHMSDDDGDGPELDLDLPIVNATAHNHQAPDDDTSTPANPDEPFDPTNLTNSAHPPPPTSLPYRQIFIQYSPSSRPVRKFSVFNGLVSHPDILLHLIQYLPPATIRNLYSISAPFHYHFNSNYQTFILAATRLWAPHAVDIFPWKCYSALCIADPGQRLPSRFSLHRTLSTPSLPSLPPHLPPPPKSIPSLRWLSMVTFRSLITREIAAYLTTSGFPVPLLPATTALQKLWFLLDIPLSGLRISLIQNTAYFSNADLATLQHVFFKLDMYFTDPISYTGGERKLRELLLAERSLTALWDWLRGATGRKVDGLRLWVRHCYDVPRRGPYPETEGVWRDWEGVVAEERRKRGLRTDGEGQGTGNGGKPKPAARILGIPIMECGRAGYELHGRGLNRLIGVEELVVNEGIRRGLELEKELLGYLRWGYLTDELEERRLPRRDELVGSLVWERQQKMKAEREKMEKGRRWEAEVEALRVAMEAMD